MIDQPKLDPIMNAEEPATPSKSPLSRALGMVSEIAQIILISLVIIIPIRYFLIQPFYVKGASMEPNFLDKEYLIIDELSYRFGPTMRTDVVVFRYPNDPRQYFIKRVIGLPGERVRVSGGKILIAPNEKEPFKIFDERSYLGDLTTSGEIELTLGPDQYFLLGDNRAASLDSRIFGPVAKDFITGRVWIRGWPPNRFTLFSVKKS